MSARLHLLCSPDAAAWRDCRSQLGASDRLLLLDRGVEWLLDPGFRAQVDALPTAGWHALREDAEARGLAGLAGDRPGLLIDRAGWVRLVEAHRHVLSWT